MKKFISLLPLSCTIFILSIVLGACTKTETVTITIQEPVAKFSVFVPGLFEGQQTQGTTNLIDSNFYFRNSSDTGSKISYTWDFGDGTTSKDKNPKHKYSKRGTYTVSLTVDNDQKASVKTEQQVSVVLGQQHISAGEDTNLMPVAIDETPANGFVLLAAVDYGNSFRLYQLDTLMRQKGMYSFPASYRLNSMEATADGNYIFTGSTQSIQQHNELIKLKFDGTRLWAKILSAGDRYSYAAPTADGGYAVVGARPAPSTSTTPYYSVVIKTDVNGNTQWEKPLEEEGLTNTKNALMEADGIVVTGLKRGNCLECDSIMVVKLNWSGAVVWKNTVFGGMNNFSWGDSRITKLLNGNYAVINSATRGIFFFSPTGVFLDRKLAPSQTVALIATEASSLTALQEEWTNGFRIRVSKIGLDGAHQWSANPEGWQKMGGSVSCCSSSQPVDIKPLRGGGTLTIGYRINNSTGFSGIYTAIVLMQINEAGKPM